MYKCNHQDFLKVQHSWSVGMPQNKSSKYVIWAGFGGKMIKKAKIIIFSRNKAQITVARGESNENQQENNSKKDKSKLVIVW